MMKIAAMSMSIVLAICIAGSASAELIEKNNVNIDTDIEHAEISAWHDDTFEEAGADELKIKTGDSELTIANSEPNGHLVYQYVCTADPSVSDQAFVDYDSVYAADSEGQVEYVLFHPDNKETVYVKVVTGDPKTHQALRVSYDPEKKNWDVSCFDSDKITDPREAVICAQFTYLDTCDVSVVTQSTKLYVRETPAGSIRDLLEQNEQVTVHRFEITPAHTDDPELEGIPYVLIVKYSKPDREGNRSLEYYGWCASQYLAPNYDAEWTDNGQK